MQSATNIAKAKRLCLEYAHDNDKILDIGPGEGEILKTLLELDRERDMNLELHALDHLEGTLNRLPPEILKQKFDLNLLRDTASFLPELPYDSNHFDIVILTEVIEHLTFPQMMVSEIARILKPDGLLVITTPNIFSLGNRLATLLGTDKVFRRVGSEGFVSTIEYSAYGHVGHYSFNSLIGLLSPWFKIIRREASDFHVPVFMYIQPVMTQLFKGLSNHIILVGRRQTSDPRLKIIACALNGDKELALPDGRCLHPMPHSITCNSCQHFHKDFLHPRDPRKVAGYVPNSR